VSREFSSVRCVLVGAPLLVFSVSVIATAPPGRCHVIDEMSLTPRAIPRSRVSLNHLQPRLRRTGIESIQESGLETIRWLYLQTKQQKTLCGRGQLFELGRAACARDEMAKQFRLFPSVEYSSGELGEVCHESLVAGCL
jgi:hypothetical protein